MTRLEAKVTRLERENSRYKELVEDHYSEIKKHKTYSEAAMERANDLLALHQIANEEEMNEMRDRYEREIERLQVERDEKEREAVEANEKVSSHIKCMYSLEWFVYLIHFFFFLLAFSPFCFHLSLSVSISVFIPPSLFPLLLTLIPPFFAPPPPSTSSQMLQR